MSVVATAAVLFLRHAALARSGALLLAASLELMVLRRALGRRESPDVWIRMRVGAAIGPGTSPPRIVDEERVSAPVEAVVAPSPRPEKSSNAHAEAPADRSANEEAGPRREEDHRGIVRGHDDKRGIHWVD